MESGVQTWGLEGDAYAMNHGIGVCTSTLWQSDSADDLDSEFLQLP